MTFPLSALLQSGSHLLGLSSIPGTKSGITLLIAHPVINLARGPMSRPQRPKLAVGTALHKVIENHLKQHQRHPMTVWLPQGLLMNMTVMAAPTTVVTSLPKMSQGRIWLILIWNQPLGIVSLVWTLNICPSELHKRGSERKSEPPVALPEAASGLRPSLRE